MFFKLPNGRDFAADVGKTTTLASTISSKRLSPDLSFTCNGKLLDVGTPLVNQGVRKDLTIHAAPRGHHTRARTHTSHAHITHIVRGAGRVYGGYCAHLDCYNLMPCLEHEEEDVCTLLPSTIIVICFFVLGPSISN